MTVPNKYTQRIDIEMGIDEVVDQGLWGKMSHAEAKVFLALGYVARHPAQATYATIARLAAIPLQTLSGVLWDLAEMGVISFKKGGSTPKKLRFSVAS